MMVVIAVIMVNNYYIDNSGLVTSLQEVKEQESHDYHDLKGSLNSKFNSQYHLWSEMVISFSAEDRQNFAKEEIRNLNKIYLNGHMNDYGSSDHLVLHS